MPPSNPSTESQRRLLLSDEGGSASLEFLTLGLILLVPLVYLVLAIAAIQGGAFAVEGAARHAARVAVLHADDGEVRGSVDRAVRLALADYGVDASRATVDIDCDSADCTTPGTRIEVSVRAEISLPLVPEALSLAQATSVPVQASSTQTVSRFAGAE